jgi:hypothetical protein
VTVKKINAATSNLISIKVAKSLSLVKKMADQPHQTPFLDQGVLQAAAMKEH